jgi:hypothetical protein
MQSHRIAVVVALLGGCVAEETVSTDTSAVSGANGIFQNGLTTNGIWQNGIWQNGIWQNGIWQNGIWQNGIWQNGLCTWEQSIDGGIDAMQLDDVTPRASSVLAPDDSLVIAGRVFAGTSVTVAPGVGVVQPGNEWQRPNSATTPRRRPTRSAAPAFTAMRWMRPATRRRPRSRCTSRIRRRR